MKNTLAMLSLVVGVGFTQVACGLSPLFHHSNPVRNTVKDDPNSVSMIASGCDFYFQSQNLCATLSWITEQNDDGYGEFTLVFWDKNAGSSDGPYHVPNAQTVGVKLWMPSMGHGSSPVKVASLKNEDGVELPGQYRATQVYFSMPGAWQIIVQFKNGKDVIDQALINHTVY